MNHDYHKYWRQINVNICNNVPLSLSPPLARWVWTPCHGRSRRWSGSWTGRPAEPPGTARAAGTLCAGTTGPRGTGQTPAWCHLQDTWRTCTAQCFNTTAHGAVFSAAFESIRHAPAGLTFNLFRHHAGIVVEMPHHFVKHTTWKTR